MKAAERDDAQKETAMGETWNSIEPDDAERGYAKVIFMVLQDAPTRASALDFIAKALAASRERTIRQLVNGRENAARVWTDDDCARAIDAVARLRERGVMTDGAIAAAVMNALRGQSHG